MAHSTSWWLVSLTAPTPTPASRRRTRRRTRRSRRARFQLFATQAPDATIATEHALAFFGARSATIEHVCKLVI